MVNPEQKLQRYQHEILFSKNTHENSMKSKNTVKFNAPFKKQILNSKSIRVTTSNIMVRKKYIKIKRKQRCLKGMMP